MIVRNFILLRAFTVEISLRSTWPKWNLHRSDFHSAWSHVNPDNEVTLHRSEIFSFSGHTGIPGLWTKSWTLDPRRWIPGPGLWTLEAKLWTLDAGLWMWNASCKTLKFKTVQSFENNGNAAISITSFLNSTLIKIPFVISGIKNYLRSAYFGLLYLTT